MAVVEQNQIQKACHRFQSYSGAEIMDSTALGQPVKCVNGGEQTNSQGQRLTVKRPNFVTINGHAKYAFEISCPGCHLARSWKALFRNSDSKFLKEIQQEETSP